MRAGWCDDNRGTCWCDKGKYAAVLPDPMADPLAPFPQAGRPMMECQPKTFPNGSETHWGGPEGMLYDDLYGEQGWCTSDNPRARCAARRAAPPGAAYRRAGSPARWLGEPLGLCGPRPAWQGGAAG